MEKIKDWLSALVTKRAEPTKLLLEDDGGQQSHGLAPFQYPPLGAPTHIRVLEILPGNPNSEIRFRLREKVLGDGEIYYAVSYTWGPPVFTHKIYSAEGFIQVTENLWEALRRYRKADELMTLWVDAVCIDQANKLERAQQIVLMRRVYSESERVLICLGRESPSDRVAFEFITHTVDLAEGKDIDNPDDLKQLADWTISKRTDENQDAVTNLFARSWFSRVWTFQEICCAAEATLTSGSLEIKFEALHEFCILFDLLKLTVWFKSIAAQRALGQIAGLHFTKDHLSQPSAENSLLELVKRNRTRIASDPKDMIYGLLALSSDTNPLPFAPTYEIDVDHLYEEFTAHVIRQNESLEIFDNCFFQPGLKKCPSWVPDWRYSENFTIPINLEEDSFNAAGESRWDTSTNIVNHSLGVDAICLDRLQNLTSPGPTPNAFGLTNFESHEVLLKWQQNIIRETTEMTSLSLLYKSELERWHAWWRTFIGERKNEVERAAPDYERCVVSYKEVLNGMSNHDLDTQNLRHREFQEVCSSVGQMENNRRFCLTLEGRIGWVPLAARTGDIVSLMRGSPVPVIIRPYQQGDSYLMIGQCYIHGIMDGEAVVGKEDQFQRIQLV